MSPQPNPRMPLTNSSHHWTTAVSSLNLGSSLLSFNRATADCVSRNKCESGSVDYSISAMPCSALTEYFRFVSSPRFDFDPSWHRFAVEAWRDCRRPLASGRKIMSRAKLLFRTVGQALGLTDLIIVRLNPDLRGRSVVACQRACKRHHPRKGKPVVRLGRKTKGHTRRSVSLKLANWMR